MLLVFGQVVTFCTLYHYTKFHRLNSWTLLLKATLKCVRESGLIGHVKHSTSTHIPVHVQCSSEVDTSSIHCITTLNFTSWILELCCYKPPRTTIFFSFLISTFISNSVSKFHNGQIYKKLKKVRKQKHGHVKHRAP